MYVHDTNVSKVLPGQHRRTVNQTEAACWSREKRADQPHEPAGHTYTGDAHDFDDTWFVWSSILSSPPLLSSLLTTSVL